MSASSLRSAIKLTRKALVELKLSSRLVTDRDRRREIELKIRAIEKLLDRAEDKTQAASETSSVSSRRFDNLNLEPQMMDKIEQKLKNIRGAAGSASSEPMRRGLANVISGQQNRYSKTAQTQSLTSQWMQILKWPYNKLKGVFRQTNKFSSAKRPQNEKPY